jgi:integron integrase
VNPVEHKPPKLLDRVRQAIRTWHYSRRTEEAYVAWIRRYIAFTGKRHPRELGATEISGFLSWLAVSGKVSASTQNQALSALLFLYRDVLEMELGLIDVAVRARMPSKLPVVLTRQEVRSVLERLEGPNWLVASLLYGAGLRLNECLALRVKDIDFERGQIIVRRGKGEKDRVTVLPVVVRERLGEHLEVVRQRHQADLRAGLGAVALPGALVRKFPGAAKDWRWQFVFRRPGSAAIRGGERRRGITFTNPWCSGRCATRCGRRA